MNEIMKNGVFINSQKVTDKIRCFVCDSPARAFMKGKSKNHCNKLYDYHQYTHFCFLSISQVRLTLMVSMVASNIRPLEITATAATQILYISKKKL